MLSQEKVDRPLSELFSELGDGTKTLVQQEIALAKAEFAHKAKRAGKHVAYIGIGAALGYAAFLALMFGLIFALGGALPLWAAALLVGLVVAAVSGLLIYEGVSDLRTMNFAPRQTVETLKEDAQWLKHQVTS